MVIQIFLVTNACLSNTRLKLTSEQAKAKQHPQAGFLLEFLFWVFGHVQKRLDEKDEVNFKTCDFTTKLKNNYNTLIAKYLKKQRQSDNEKVKIERISALKI